MPRVKGFLHIIRRGHPDHGLPGEEGPVDPDYGIDEGPEIDGGLPEPPPGIWPPLTPSHPIQPAPPGTPPGSIWPPVGGRPERPDRPAHPIAPGGGPVRPDQGLPPAGGTPPVPGAPDQGLPGRPSLPERPDRPKVYWVVAGIPGVGWRYVAVDPEAIPPLPPRPEPK
jgi:hypothetical protein